MKHEGGHLTKSAPEGVISLLLTPFHADGAIDWATYDAYVDWQVARRPAGLFAVCGSSEMKWLEPDERLQLAARAVERAGGLPVIATANLRASPSEHRDELARMADTGIAAAVLVPPALSASREHYREYLYDLASAAPCPIMLYEWPQAEHHQMDAELFGELAREGLVAGIKDTTCTLEGISAKQQAAVDAVVFQANTPLLLDALAIGVRGIMAVTSTARADLLVRLWRDYAADLETATRLHRELVFLDALLRLAYPATAKYLVALQGLPMPVATRWPTTLTREICKALDVWHHGMREEAS